jgi:hypothetical protein
VANWRGRITMAAFGGLSRVNIGHQDYCEGTGVRVSQAVGVRRHHQVLKVPGLHGVPAPRDHLVPQLP